MEKISIIVRVLDGLTSVRVHRTSYTDVKAREHYLACLGDVPVGTRYEFHNVDLFADIGETSGPVLRYDLQSDGSWERVGP